MVQLISDIYQVSRNSEFGGPRAAWYAISYKTLKNGIPEICVDIFSPNMMTGDWHSGISILNAQSNWSYVSGSPIKLSELIDMYPDLLTKLSAKSLTFNDTSHHVLVRKYNAMLNFDK